MARVFHIAESQSGGFECAVEPITVAPQGNDNSWFHNQFDAARDNHVASVDVAGPAVRKSHGMKI